MDSELGIDEAGRGSILGPLVLAGVLVAEDRKRQLMEWGITDSKHFGSQKKGKLKRKKLAEKISSSFQCDIIVLSSEVVDHYVEHLSLNRLEQDAALEIIRRIPADKVVLDGENLFKPIVSEKISAINKADSSHISVAAASILAKAQRDRLFDLVCRDFLEDFGEIRGGGYANQQTLKFVKWYLKTKGDLPPFFRKSYRWKNLGTT